MFQNICYHGSLLYLAMVTMPDMTMKQPNQKASCHLKSILREAGDVEGDVADVVKILVVVGVRKNQTH
jgi:hypothetical protein